MASLSKIARLARERGPVWTGLYAARWLGLRAVGALERRLAAIEVARFIVGESTVSSARHTAEENRRIWNTYDWSRRGEEWTEAVAEYRGLDPVAWKRQLVEGVMRRWIPAGASVLEIGPGAGRWTESLVDLAGPLAIADISEACLELCRSRFGGRPHTSFHLIGADGLSFLEDASIDAAWSYDVFVHINPSDVQRYVRDLGRVLAPGGIAVIHHSGRYRSEADASSSFRSHMDSRFFAHLVEAAGLEVVEQDTTSPHKPGDLITVFRRPA